MLALTEGFSVMDTAKLAMAASAVMSFVSLLKKNKFFMSLNIEMIGCVKFPVCVMGLEFLKIARNHNRACALRHFARREAGRRVVN